MAQQQGNGNNTFIIVGALGVGAYFLYKRQVKPVVKEIVQAKAVKKAVPALRVMIPVVKLTKTSLDFGIRIENPTPTAITVKAIVGEVHLVSNDGKTNYKIGNVDKYGTTVVKPTAQTDFSFSVKLKAVELFRYFTDLVQGKIKGQMVVFTGTINIDGHAVPVKEQYKIS